MLVRRCKGTLEQPYFVYCQSPDARLPGARGGRADRADLVHLGRCVAEAWSPITCTWAAWNGTGRMPGLEQAGARGPNRARMSTRLK